MKKDFIFNIVISLVILLAGFSISVTMVYLSPQIANNLGSDEMWIYSLGICCFATLIPISILKLWKKI